MSITSVDRAQLFAKQVPLVRPLVLWALRLAALVAAGVSGYLAWITLAGAGSLGCSGGFDCDEVLNSGWSRWFGLPVSLPALSLYVSLLCTLAFSGPLAPENVRRIAWTVSLWLCTLAGAAALWFIGLQVFVVGSYCQWCLTIHICGLGAAALALFAGRHGFARLQGAAAISLTGIVVLVMGQFLGTPQTKLTASQPTTAQRLTLDDLYSGVDHTNEAAVDDPATPIDEVDPPPLTPDDLSPPTLDDLSVPPLEQPNDDVPPIRESDPSQHKSRIITLVRGNVQVDAYQHPVLGSPTALHVIVKLYDYTCPHCRMMHEHMQKAREQFGGDLAVVMCPVPLNKQCNPHMQFDNPKHAEACDLARLALAVWQADPTKFAEFDAWLFAPPVHPSAAAAREKVIALVGEAALVKELYGENLRERLAVGPKLYKLVGAGTVPKLLLPTGMLVGPGESSDRVIQELEQDFSTQRSPPLP